MGNEIVLSDKLINKRIFIVRGIQVILDKDLAELYEVETGNLNKAVRRNIERFPDDFMFQLTNEEYKNLNFQFGISSWGGTRKPPYAFTEQGVAILSGVLKSKKAVKVNIQIMRAFIDMRRFMIIDNKEVYHIGASLKDLGKKWFAFSKFDKGMLNILNKLPSMKQ